MLLVFKERESREFGPSRPSCDAEGNILEYSTQESPTRELRTECRALAGLDGLGGAAAFWG